MAEVSTICVVGFPNDAGLRERKNYCQFMQGFERAVVSKTATMFVKFVSHEFALMAIEQLNTTPYDQDNPDSSPVRAELAKGEMTENTKQHPVALGGAVEPAPMPYQGGPAPRMGFHAGPAAPMQQFHAFPPQAAQPYTPGPPAMKGKGGGKGGLGFPGAGAGGPPRRRADEDPSQVYTVAVLGLHSKGLTEAYLQDLFSQATGFIQCKEQTAVNGCFATFETPELARAAVEFAIANGVQAEMARRNAFF